MIIPLLGAIANRHRKYFLTAICLKTFLPSLVLTAEYLVDYEGADCSKSYNVGNFDVFRLEAKPRNDINTGKDRCFNQFLATDNLKLKIYVKTDIRSCGIFLRFFDGDPHMNKPRWTIGCNTNTQDIYLTYSSELIVRLDKPVSDSTNSYSFTTYITNEKGPVIDFEEKKTSGMDGGVSGGVIAGIAVGVGLVVIVIIVIIVIVAYRWMKKKEKEHKPYKPQTVFTTTTSKSVGEPNGILKRSDSSSSRRRDKRSKYEGQGYENKAYRNSVDGDSVTVSGMPDRAADFDDVEKNSGRDGRSEGRGSVGRSSRSRRRDYYDRSERSDARSTSTDDTLTTDSVFTNKAFEDEERGPGYRAARRDLYREENESWTSGKVSYRTDTTRTRSDSPSRDSHGSSTTTDGTTGSSYEPRFNKKDNGRVERSRSHSRSSLRSQSERKKRQQSQSTDRTDSSSRRHRPHGQGHHRQHRSRSRERQKKPSPYNDIWVEEKKKQRERRK